MEANFDQILALIRVLAEMLGIYLLNSMNPFRVEGQKTIMFEMLDQRDWRVPDWVVLPGGNLGNVSAFGKGLREAKAAGLIDKLPKLAVIQAEGSATLAGIRKLVARGTVDRGADVVAVLTGNVMKDPDYIYKYHTGQLEAPDGSRIESTFGNRAMVVPNDADKIAELLR